MKKSFILLILFALILSILGPGCNSTEVDMSNIKYIAHRGLSALYYQNTLEAFEKAAESGVFYGIETDVWRTADGIWVCTHDRDPFEDGTLFIDEISYEVAKSTPLAHSKSRGVVLEEDVYICSLDAYLEICLSNDIIAVIEIKNDYSKEDLVNLIDQIQSKLSNNKFFLITFFLGNLPVIEEIDNSIMVQALVSKKKDASSALKEKYNLGISHKLLTTQIVKKAKSDGLLVNVWTVNEEKLAKKYIGMGADFITTDKIFVFD